MKRAGSGENVQVSDGCELFIIAFIVFV